MAHGRLCTRTPPCRSIWMAACGRLSICSPSQAQGKRRVRRRWSDIFPRKRFRPMSERPMRGRHGSRSGQNVRTITRRISMQYLLLLHADENGWSRMTAAEQQQGYAAYMAYTEALKKAGAYVGSNRLQPVSSATTVKIANGKQQVLDGPYADAK